MKIAKLVRTSFVTRILVDDIAKEEEILSVAKYKLIEQICNDGISEHLDGIVDDTEMTVITNEPEEKTDADFYCDVTVVFFDKNGKLQTATVIHDGTEDCWDSKEIDGSMYDFNTYDTRVFGDSSKGAIGCGVDLLTEKDGDYWTRDNSIDMVVNKITWVRKINQ